jgi:hypothetical protein
MRLQPEPGGHSVWIFLDKKKKIRLTFSVKVITAVFAQLTAEKIITKLFNVLAIVMSMVAE